MPLLCPALLRYSAGGYLLLSNLFYYEVIAIDNEIETLRWDIVTLHNQRKNWICLKDRHHFIRWTDRSFTQLNYLLKINIWGFFGKFDGTVIRIMYCTGWVISYSARLRYVTIIRWNLAQFSAQPNGFYFSILITDSVHVTFSS